MIVLNSNVIIGWKYVILIDEKEKFIMTELYTIPSLPLPYDFETKEIYRQLNLANKKLAELKGVALTIPNEDILINTLTLQEAKDSSAIENIVTTQDDLYKAELNMGNVMISASAKEVLSYRQAIKTGFYSIRKTKILSINLIKSIQQELEHNDAGFRTIPGTVLKNSAGKSVYVPPQDNESIIKYMNNLEAFINNSDLSNLDPLVKMAIVHHQFESIHPFYDGNGRTGRIISILYLVVTELLDIPILYLSRYITHNKSDYYYLLQSIRDKNSDNAKEWENWIVFILKGVEETATDTIRLVKGIRALMDKYKQCLRPIFGKQYKHELLNNLFFHPYTKIEFMAQDMMVQRIAATKYLNKIVAAGLLTKIKKGRTNYYLNKELINLFLSVGRNLQDANTVITVNPR